MLSPKPSMGILDSIRYWASRAGAVADPVLAAQLLLSPLFSSQLRLRESRCRSTDDGEGLWGGLTPACSPDRLLRCSRCPGGLSRDLSGVTPPASPAPGLTHLLLFMRPGIACMTWSTAAMSGGMELVPQRGLSYRSMEPRGVSSAELLDGKFHEGTTWRSLPPSDLLLSAL